MLSNNLNNNNNNISDSLEAMNLIETDLKLNPEIGSNETQIQTQTQTPLKSNNNKSERLKECFLQNIRYLLIFFYSFTINSFVFLLFFYLIYSMLTLNAFYYSICLCNKFHNLTLFLN
jgi:hypothetical protein